MNMIPSRRKASPEPDTTAPAEPVNLKFDGLAMLREASPEYAKLADRFAELIAKEEKLLADIREPADLARRHHNEIERIQRAMNANLPPAPPPQHDPAALALLEDIVTLEPPPARPSPFAAKNEFQVTADQLSAELAAVREAIRLLRPKLQAAHLVASRVLCEKLTPEYRVVAQKYIDAIVQLGLATKDYETFVNSIKSAAWSCIRPIAVSQSLGKPDEPSSEFRRLIAFAAETGHLDLDTIPEDWKVKRYHG